MTKAGTENNWDRYLAFFAKEWSGRPTRLGVFEPNQNAADDYWLECGVPFDSWTMDTKAGHRTLHLQLGRLRHEIREPRQITFHLTIDGQEDGIDVLDSQGRKTILRFEV